MGSYRSYVLHPNNKFREVDMKQYRFIDPMYYALPTNLLKEGENEIGG